MKFIIKITTIMCLIFATNSLSAQVESDIVGTWYNQEGTAKIKVFKATNGKFAGMYYGKIVWLKIPNKEGKPKVDAQNPDETKRNKPIIGLVILSNLAWNPELKAWTDGQIYDPNNGKTYSCAINKDGKNLKVRGFKGLSITGKSSTWSPAD